MHVFKQINLIILALFLTLCLASGSSHAQTKNKVVVIPLGADNPPPQTKFLLSMLDMSPLNEGTGWSRAIGYNHVAGGDECIIGPIDPVAGQKVSTLSTSYVNQTASNISLNIQVLGLRVSAGPIPGGNSDLFHSVISHASSYPPTPPASGVVAATLGAEPDNTIRSNFRYAVTICTADDVLITGATVTLTN